MAEKASSLAEDIRHPLEAITPDKCEVCDKKAEWHTGYVDHLASYNRPEWSHDPPHWLCQKHQEKWSDFHDENSDFLHVISGGEMTSQGFQAFFEVFLMRAREYEIRRRWFDIFLKPIRDYQRGRK